MTEDEIGRVIVDTAIGVHRGLGPGLFESVYEQVLAVELRDRGLSVVQQKSIPIRFKQRIFEEGFKADLIVNGKVLVELKSIEKLLPIHRKQVVTYLRLGDFRLGFLINFNVPLLKDGIERLVNGLIE